MEWADLAVIDLSLADTPAGIQELAKLAVEAMTREGFFYVVNHGYTSEQVLAFSVLIGPTANRAMTIATITANRPRGFSTSQTRRSI